MVQVTIKRVNAPVWERATWTRDRDTLVRRLKRWRRKSWFDDKAEKFALSKCRVDDDDHLWECTEMLGRGSFGMVGQWTKFDTHRRAVDVIAIKQAELDPREVDCQGNPTVPMEAMIMKALELQGCGNVSVLRTVRFFPGTREDGAKPRWRFYLDFYRHGTLHDLVGRYVEANSRRQPNQAERIPEAFVWQAFNDLAQACYHMSIVRLDPSLEPPGRDFFVLHLDLKPDNILLGDPPSDPKKMNYPTLKIADWGMAEYTSVEDSKNSKQWKLHGTPRWYPPEQRKHGQYGRNWRHPILGPPNQPFTMAHVVWQVGACVLGLLGPEPDNRDLNDRLRDIEAHEAHLRRHDYSPLLGYKSTLYSRALTALCEDCVCVDPARRPSPCQLLDRTAAGLAPYTEQYQRTGVTPNLKGV